MTETATILRSEQVTRTEWRELCAMERGRRGRSANKAARYHAILRDESGRVFLWRSAEDHARIRSRVAAALRDRGMDECPVADYSKGIRPGVVGTAPRQRRVDVETANRWVLVVDVASKRFGCRRFDIEKGWETTHRAVRARHAAWAALWETGTEPWSDLAACLGVSNQALYNARDRVAERAPVGSEYRADIDAVRLGVLALARRAA